MISNTEERKNGIRMIGATAVGVLVAVGGMFAMEVVRPSSTPYSTTDLIWATTGVGCWAAVETWFVDQTSNSDTARIVSALLAAILCHVSCIWHQFSGFPVWFAFGFFEAFSRLMFEGGMNIYSDIMCIAHDAESEGDSDGDFDANSEADAAADSVANSVADPIADSIVDSAVDFVVDSHADAAADSAADSDADADSETSMPRPHLDNKEEMDQDHKAAMVRALDQGEKLHVDPRRLSKECEVDKMDDSVWNNPFDWDVLVICGKYSWRLHRHILTKESAYFAERLPQSPSRLEVFPLPKHDPGMLSAALGFMYAKSYDGASLNPDHPFHAEPILKNTAMFIAGASIACQSMMDFAVAHINEATSTIEKVIHNHYRDFNFDYNVLCLEKPVRMALNIVYSQPDQQGMGCLENPESNRLYSLRLALAKFIDGTMMYLVISSAFKVAYRNEWRNVSFQVAQDNWYFAKKGLLEAFDGPTQEIIDKINAGSEESDSEERTGEERTDMSESMAEEEERELTGEDTEEGGKEADSKSGEQTTVTFDDIGW